jgi:hypothetical protein
VLGVREADAVGQLGVADWDGHASTVPAAVV